MYRSIIICLLIILSLLEYRFWFSGDSFFKTRNLQKVVRENDAELSALVDRNNRIMEHVQYLKQHPAAIEGQARYELGMVKRGEKYYQIVDRVE